MLHHHRSCAHILRSSILKQGLQMLVPRSRSIHEQHAQSSPSSRNTTLAAATTLLQPSPTTTSTSMAAASSPSIPMQSHAAFLVLGATLSSYRSAMRRSVTYTSLVREWATLTSLMQRVGSSLPKDASLLRQQAEALQSGLAAVIQTTTHQMADCKDLHSLPTNAISAILQLYHMYQVLKQLLARCGTSCEEGTAAVQEGVKTLLQATPQHAATADHAHSGGRSSSGNTQLDMLAATVSSTDVSAFYQELWAHTVTQVVASDAWHFSHTLGAARLLLTGLAASCAMVESDQPDDDNSAAVLASFRPFSFGGRLSVAQDAKAQALAELHEQLTPSAQLVWRRIHHEAFNLAAHKLSILTAATSTGGAANVKGPAATDFPLLQFLQSVKWESLTAAATVVHQVPADQLPTATDAELLQQTQQAARIAVSSAGQRLISMVHAYNEACRGALLPADTFACSQAWVDAVLSAALCAEQQPETETAQQEPNSRAGFSQPATVRQPTQQGPSSTACSESAVAQLIHEVKRLNGRCSEQANQALDTMDAVLVSGWDRILALQPVACTAPSPDTSLGYGTPATGGSSNNGNGSNGIGSVNNGNGNVNSGSISGVSGNTAGIGTVQAACPAQASQYLSLLWTTDSPDIGSSPNVNDSADADGEGVEQPSTAQHQAASLQGVLDLFKARCELSRRPPSAALCALVQAEVVAAADASTAEQAAAVAVALGLTSHARVDAAEDNASSSTSASVEGTGGSSPPGDQARGQQLMVLDALHRLLAVHVVWVEQQQLGSEQQPQAAAAAAPTSGLDVDLLLTKLALCVATLPDDVWIQQDFRRHLYPSIVKLVCGPLSQPPEELLVDHYMHTMQQLLLASIDPTRVPMDSNKVPVMTLPDRSPAWAAEHVPLTADDIAAIVQVASLVPEHMLPDGLQVAVDVAVMQMGEAAQRAHFLRCRSWGTLLSALMDAGWQCPLAACQLLQLGVQAPEVFGPGLEVRQLVEHLPQLHPALDTDTSNAVNDQLLNQWDEDKPKLDVRAMYDMLCLRTHAMSNSV